MPLLNVVIIRWLGAFLLVLWLVACIIWDVRTRTVPGWLTVLPLAGAALARLLEGMWRAPALVAGLILASDLPRPLRIPAASALALGLAVMSPTADLSILATLLGIWIMWELYLAGGADAKIMMAVVLMVGHGVVVIPIAIAGAALALVAAIRKKRTIPYTAAIALGTFFYQLILFLHPEGSP